MKPQACQVAVDEACESPTQWQCWNWAPRIDPWNSAGTNGRKSKPVQGETWDQAGWTKPVRCYRKTKQTLTDLQKKTWPHVQPKTTLSYNQPCQHQLYVPGDKIHLSFSNILSTYIDKKWVCVRRETPHARDIIAGMRNTQKAVEAGKGRETRKGSHPASSASNGAGRTVETRRKGKIEQTPKSQEEKSGRKNSERIKDEHILRRMIEFYEWKYKEKEDEHFFTGAGQASDQRAEKNRTGFFSFDMPRCKIESGKEKVESKYGRVNATSRTILITTVSGPLFSKMHIKPIPVGKK